MTTSDFFSLVLLLRSHCKFGTTEISLSQWTKSNQANMKEACRYILFNMQYFYAVNDTLS